MDLGNNLWSAVSGSRNEASPKSKEPTVPYSRNCTVIILVNIIFLRNQTQNLCHMTRSLLR